LPNQWEESHEFADKKYDEALKFITSKDQKMKDKLNEGMQDLKQ